MILYIILLYIIYLSILFWLKKKKNSGNGNMSIIVSQKHYVFDDLRDKSSLKMSTSNWLLSDLSLISASNLFIIRLLLIKITLTFVRVSLN